MLKPVAVIAVAVGLCAATAFASNDGNSSASSAVDVTAPKVIALAPSPVVKPPSREKLADREAVEDNASVSLGIGPFVRPNLGLVFTR